MVSTLPTSVSAVVRPVRRRVPLRLYLLGRSALLMVTSLVGALLFAVWLTAVAISPITLFAPLVLPVTRLVRAYADHMRRDARRLTGWPMRGTYRIGEDPGVLRRVWSIERDRQSWRDAWWCLSHSVVATTFSALLTGLFAGTMFYLCYPLLYWVTPHNVFGRPFGGLVELDSVAQSCLMMPLALVCFGLWYALVLPLTRTELRLTRRLLAA
jgi:hypothetical protein